MAYCLFSKFIAVSSCFGLAWPLLYSLSLSLSLSISLSLILSIYRSLLSHSLPFPPSVSIYLSLLSSLCLSLSPSLSIYLSRSLTIYLFLSRSTNFPTLWVCLSVFSIPFLFAFVCVSPSFLRSLSRSLFLSLFVSCFSSLFFPFEYLCISGYLSV